MSAALTNSILCSNFSGDMTAMWIRVRSFFTTPCKRSGIKPSLYAVMNTKYQTGCASLDLPVSTRSLRLVVSQDLFESVFIVRPAQRGTKPTGRIGTLLIHRDKIHSLELELIISKDFCRRAALRCNVGVAA